MSWIYLLPVGVRPNSGPITQRRRCCSKAAHRPWKKQRMMAQIVRPGKGEAMAADPACARCKQPIGPGWLYLIAHRRGQAATTDDDAVFIHVPDECPRPGEHVPRS